MAVDINNLTPKQKQHDDIIKDQISKLEQYVAYLKKELYENGFEGWKPPSMDFQIGKKKKKKDDE